MTTKLVDSQFDSNFKLQLPGKVVVLFYRPGCPHCDVYHPEYVKAAQKGYPGVTFSEINTSEHPNVLSRLANMSNPPFSVRGVPTVVCFNNGKYYSTYGANNEKFRTVEDTLEYASGIGSAPIVYKK